MELKATDQPKEQNNGARGEKATAPALDAEKRYCVSLFPGRDRPIDTNFAKLVLGLEQELNMPVWLLIQTGDTRLDILDSLIRDSFVVMEDELPINQPVALLIDSPGGSSRTAYQVAMILRRRCGSFTALVPRYAKSAATLMILGADQIILGSHAELGPLDVQIYDYEKEEFSSALDEVHSLDELFRFAIEAFEQTLDMLEAKTNKKKANLMPIAMEFVANLTRPLFQHIDSVHYTHMSRALKVAEDYAVRLLKDRCGEDKAKEIARHLVEDYPEHGFVIFAEEAKSMGLPIGDASETANEILSTMYLYLRGKTHIGKIEEMPPDEQEEQANG